MADFLAYGYAATVAAGGVLGYVKAGSTASLVMGLLFGGVLTFGAYQISNDPKNFWVQFGSSLVLGGVMGYRFYNTGKLMPAGAVAILSLIMAGKYAISMSKAY